MQNRYTVCVFSNRMYKNIINSDFVNHCNETMIQYQKTVFSVYNLLYLKTFLPEEYDKITNGYKSLYLYVVNHFGFNVYYSNSIINLAKGILYSQITLNKDYIEQKQEQIKTIQIKLNVLEKSLNNYLLLRKELPSYKEKLNKNPKTKIHIQGIKNLSFLPDKVIVRFNINKQKEYGYGEFEYQYLNNKIRWLKNLISKYHYRIHNIENKIQNLMSVNHIFFRKNIINQIHKETDIYKIKKLKLEFINSKYYRFQISGVNVAKYGNYIFQMTYIPVSDDFDVKIKFPNKEITLHHIDFPYKKEEIIDTLKYNLNQKNHKKLPHISANYVIARRGLGYKEQLLKEQRQQIPQEMKEYSLFKKWQYINKLA